MDVGGALGVGVDDDLVDQLHQLVVLRRRNVFRAEAVVLFLIHA